MRQCFAITTFLSGLVPRSATFSSRLTNLLDLTSSCTHKDATSMCFNLPFPCLWRMCSVASASMASTGFISYTESFNNGRSSFRPRRSQCCRIQLCLCDASRNDLLLARVCVQSVAAGAVSRLRLMLFRVSLHPAQSESERVVTSSTILPQLNICPSVSRVSNI